VQLWPNYQPFFDWHSNGNNVSHFPHLYFEETISPNDNWEAKINICKYLLEFNHFLDEFFEFHAFLYPFIPD